jgi:general L-amino acid transport system substrate-binding protein
VIRWVLFGLIEAEELGVTSQNAEQLRAESQNPSIRRLLGTVPELGQAVKLQASWMFDAIRAVGNYGELYERNLGTNTPIGLPRGANDLWTRGGLMYAWPLR